MVKKLRSWCLSVALFVGIVLVMPDGENKVFGQGTPLPQPKPVLDMPGTGYPGAPNAYPAPVPGPYAITGSSTKYPGGANSTTPAVLPFNAAPPLFGEHPLPINLATALRLANAQAWDIGIASQQIRVAAAQLTQANVLWLPTLTMGGDYLHHDGIIQSVPGAISGTNKNAIELGGSPELVFSLSEAIFQPLAARQVEKARKADLQTATNDITFNVAKAYFDVQQARGNLSAVQDTIKRTKEVLSAIEKLTPNFFPEVEIYRAKAQLAAFEAGEQSVREFWNVASAELTRITRLDPTAVVVPMEPPHLQVTLVSPDQPLDNLLPVALSARPELVAYQALTQAALKRWREEQFRPALPNFYLRGGNGELPDSMMFGGFTGGQNGSYGALKPRVDYEFQMMWELRNMGLGNAAAMRERRADYDVTRMQAYRLQDFVAKEVVQAYVQVRSARERVTKAEEELKQAHESAIYNLKGLGTLKRVTETVLIPIIRPQEAVVSMTALLAAYNHYYGSVADYNRYEFALYRALGNPGQILAAMDAESANCAPPPINTNPNPPPPAAPPPPPNMNPVGSAPGDMTRSMPAGGNNAIVQQAAAKVDGTTATVLVRVPSEAELYCDGTKMRLTGSERNFVTPPLPPGRTYPYELRIRWIGADGRPVEVTRQVQVQAGQVTQVDFMARGPN